MSKVPENEEAREWLAKASNLRDMLQEALLLLEDATSGFVPGNGGDRDWKDRRDSLLAAAKFEHFGGPEPEGHPF